MTSEELHNYLLKNIKQQYYEDKKGLDRIVEIKNQIRNYLRDFRRTQPCEYMLHAGNALHPEQKSKNVVFYSFWDNPEKPEIAEHEWKRLKISWKSLRKHNKDIEVRFCYSGDKFRYAYDFHMLAEEYNITLYNFHDSFTGKEPNAWCIHRWYNLANWENEDLNILYLDADTYINGDVGLIFDIYSRDPIYGREELGFRHDPNFGDPSADPRFFLDLIDAGIAAQGGKVEVNKYCLGVILLNHSIHKMFKKSVMDRYTDLLTRIRNLEAFYPIYNYRIIDEFAFWILISRWGMRTGLFGDQDVSQTFLERKHETHFNPIILHYTTKDENKFGDWAPEFMSLIRTNQTTTGEEPVNPMLWEELSMTMF